MRRRGKEKEDKQGEKEEEEERRMKRIERSFKESIHEWRRQYEHNYNVSCTKYTHAQNYNV